METEIIRPAPGRFTSQDPVWVRVADGIWKNTTRKKPWLYERPVIGGKETYKGLGQTSLKFAKEELAKRVTARSQGFEPTAKVTSATTVGTVIRLYIAEGYPDKMLNTRPSDMRESEAKNCETLLGFWDPVPIADCTSGRCDEYRDWRIEHKTRAQPGTRAIDLELNTLTNAFRLAKRRDTVLFNPMLDAPKYHDPRNVRHCRDFMPADADELHKLVRPLFQHPRSVVLGFQYLYECMTGLRTTEILKLGTVDPKTEIRHGSLTEDGKYMRVWRAKGQQAVNPYVQVHDGLRAVMGAHRDWLEKHHPGCAIFFPSPGDSSKVVGSESLAHALERLPGKKITSHGGRAFYVTVRRSWGIADSVIAFEIGHTSGGATLARVYGGVPANWITDGPKMSWLPKRKLAWA
jgi:hypothetical protein